MTYSEALDYIHSINWTFCKPGLQRISELCERLGNPQDDLKFIHVAGTNGKGSFCAMLDEVLRRASYKVGLYTSPYIKEFNERMRVDGENISDSELAEITEYVRPIADSMKDKPTEFELITAIAFEFFKRHGCDVVILEAGLGGRLDSTNIVKSSILSVITGIALEHTEFLGDTIPKIAAEKAGIIKRGVPVLYGGDDDSANEVISTVALDMGCEYHRTHKGLIKIRNTDLSGTEFSYGKYDRLCVGLLGVYQAHNAANVVEAVNILNENGYKISNDALRYGLENTVWHARFEIINRSPLMIFDGAHNPQGIDVAVESIKTYFGNEKVCIISGVMKDKNYRYIASRLSEIADFVFTVTPDNPRALDSVEYAKTFGEYGVDALGCKSISEAIEAAKGYAVKNSKAIICLGSLYMYGDIIKNI